MMGQIDEWFFAWLAGIQPDTDFPGYERFIVHPQVVGDLTSVSASTETLYGKISVDWKIENNTFQLNVEVPVNTRARIILPDKQSHDVGSGKYSYSVKL